MSDPAVCLHEATHAAVALRRGLVVRRLQSGGWVRVPRYCSQLYGIRRGIPLRSPICLLADDCLDTDPESVLIAMAAPAYLESGSRRIDSYARLEALLATRYAQKLRLDSTRVQFYAATLAEICEPEARALAERLEEAGLIVGADL
jgi:hypothetical protein